MTTKGGGVDMLDFYYSMPTSSLPSENADTPLVSALTLWQIIIAGCKLNRCIILITARTLTPIAFRGVTVFLVGGRTSARTVLRSASSTGPSLAGRRVCFLLCKIGIAALHLWQRLTECLPRQRECALE
mmetsp:Transcript_83075/g.158600  ORF Transcript_83075/g.158600 Transcript_83075/m.158600 type:complete len:129 (-) Transcript_83075:1431-1817(-)